MSEEKFFLLHNSKASISNLEHNFLKDKTDTTSDNLELTQTNKMGTYNTGSLI